MTTNFKTLLGGLLLTASLVACSNSDSPSNGGSSIQYATNDFQIAFASGSGSNSATLVQGVSDLSTGTVSAKIGHELESSRTARIFVSSDRKYLYSLNYTVGTIEKLEYKGADQYTAVGKVDASVPLGSKTVRFTKMSDTEGSVHYIQATAQGTGVAYTHHKHLLTIGILDLERMIFKPGFAKAVEITLPEALAKAGYYISRIDCPVESAGKLYYGAAVSKWNATTGKGLETDKTFTLVVDKADLSKASVVYTDKVRGATNGYRTPTQHMMEDGSIIQLVSGTQDNARSEVHIVRLKAGQYDESFDINLASLLGKPMRSDGFFYAGNGIAYVPYEDQSLQRIQIGVDPDGKPTMSAPWKLARVDLRRGTAIDLNVPDNLWLRQYQNAVVRDGVFYIALAPIAKQGHIYMFDVNSTSPTGSQGANLEGTGADQYFIGIY